jgi:hypothetical protein
MIRLEIERDSSIALTRDEVPLARGFSEEKTKTKFTERNDPSLEGCNV